MAYFTKLYLGATPIGRVAVGAEVIDLVAAAGLDVQAVWMGPPAADAIRATFNLNGAPAGPAIVQAATDAGFTSLAASVPVSVDPRYPFARAQIGGLTADTEYHLRLVNASGAATGRRGRFRTAPASGDFAFLCASCSNSGSNAAIFDTMRTSNPDALFFQHLGDVHYYDIGINDEALFHDAYDAVFASARQADLWSALPMPYMWDDHDYGLDNSNASSPSRQASVAAFRRRVPSAPLVLSGPEDAIYHSYRVGRVLFAVLDLRSEKTGSQMMSAAQEAWLLGLMDGMAATDAMVIVSSVPWIATGVNDTWGATTGTSAQRTRIADAVTARIPGRAMIVSGDMHALAYDDGTNSEGGIPVLQSAPISRSNSSKGGPYTTGPIQASPYQYSRVEVTETAGGVSLRSIGYSVDDATGVQTQRMDHTTVLQAAASPEPAEPVYGRAVSAYFNTDTPAGIAPSDAVGLAPKRTNWRRSDGAMVMDDGTASTMTITVGTTSGAQHTITNQGTTSTPDAWLMKKGYAMSSDLGTFATVSGIDFARYDMWVYYETRQGVNGLDARHYGVTIGDQTVNWTQQPTASGGQFDLAERSAFYSDTPARSSNVALYRDLTGSSHDLIYDQEWQRHSIADGHHRRAGDREDGHRRHENRRPATQAHRSWRQLHGRPVFHAVSSQQVRRHDEEPTLRCRRLRHGRVIVRQSARLCRIDGLRRQHRDLVGRAFQRFGNGPGRHG